MTDTTNQCSCHKKIEKSISTIEHEIDDKIWPVIRGMVQWKHLLIIGAIVIAFGLILLNSNSDAIEKNSAKIECLKKIAEDVSVIKAAVVKK